MKSILSFFLRSISKNQPEQVLVRLNEDTKWIFCGGMLRSGSTLQYNIAAEIVERSSIGRREVWVDDHGAYFANATTRGATVFKSHVLSRSLDHLLRTSQSLALISFRDVRDATASWQSKTRTQLSVAEGVRFSEKAIKLFEPWEQLSSKCAFSSKYEDVVADIPAEVKRMAEWLGVVLDQSEIKAIGDFVSIPSMAQTLKNSGPDTLTQSGAHTWNTKTLVHTDHLNGGDIGRYKKELSRELTEELTHLHSDWLLSHGYEL